MLRLSTIAIIVVMLTTSCNKEDEVVPSDEDTKEFLLAGSSEKTWKIISSTRNDFERLPECIEDDDWIFKREYTFYRNTTNLPCSNGIPDNEWSSWYFSIDEAWLTFGGGTFKIKLLTEEEMVLSYSIPNRVTYVDTYTKK